MHPLMSSIVRILNGRSQVVGLGFLVSEKQVVTPTYVVSAALFLEETNTLEMPTSEVHLVFASVKHEKLFTSRIIHWWPGGKEKIAVLELKTHIPNDVQPALLVTSRDLTGHKFRSFGLPMHYDEGVWISGELQEEVAGWVQLETSRENAIGPGSGGAPVWDERLMGVVGMITAAGERGSKLGFMVPVSRMVEIWPELNEYVVQKDSQQDNTQDETQFVGPISGQIHTGSGDTTIRIAREALISSEASGPTRFGVDAEGDVVMVEPDTAKVMGKLSQEAAYERLAATADATRKQIEQIHDQGRKQAEQWSRFSLIAAIVGFLIVLGGGLALLIGNTPAGLVTSAAGIIPEVAAALFFQQAREANKRVDDIRGRLLEAEGIHRAIELSMTTNEETQNRLKEAIILRILGLPAKGQEVQISKKVQSSEQQHAVIPSEEG